MTVSLRSGAMLSLVLVCLVVPCSLSADRVESRSELRIRVMTPYREDSRSFWNVTISAPGFESQEVVAESGQWVAFRKLPASNYSVCVTGARGRHSCTTVEVPATRAGSRARVDFDYEAPRSDTSNLLLRRSANALASASTSSSGRTVAEGSSVQTDREESPGSVGKASSKQPPTLNR